MSPVFTTLHIFVVVAALSRVTTVSGQGSFMVPCVAWSPAFDVMHSLPRLFCTLVYLFVLTGGKKVKSDEYAFMGTLEEKKKEHHCDFM